MALSAASHLSLMPKQASVRSIIVCAAIDFGLPDMRKLRRSAIIPNFTLMTR